MLSSSAKYGRSPRVAPRICATRCTFARSCASTSSSSFSRFAEIRAVMIGDDYFCRSYCLSGRSYPSASAGCYPRVGALGLPRVSEPSRSEARAHRRFLPAVVVEVPERAAPAQQWSTRVRSSRGPFVRYPDIVECHLLTVRDSDNATQPCACYARPAPKSCRHRRGRAREHEATGCQASPFFDSPLHRPQ
jgi:hypothetical protein